MKTNMIKKIFQALKFQATSITNNFLSSQSKISKNKNNHVQNSKRLVISYCFPPYVDTAGNVMAKRIRSMEEKVDVIYNKMDRVREVDLDLNLLVDDRIGRRYEISSYSSFSNWKAISQFMKMGLNEVQNIEYESIYSRVMWPASNFLAYEYKAKHPHTKWIAEFSDPILLDIKGDIRKAELGNQKFLNKANELIAKKYGFSKVSDSNLFFWCEYLTYLFADEIIFTNENQYKYMMENFPITEVVKLVKSKATISPQPSLEKKYYSLKESNYKIDKNKTNLAYFGGFYSTRNLNELLLGLEALDDNARESIRLHIFTSDPKLLQRELIGSPVEQCIIVNSYVSFFEFLNLTLKFDCLIVNDAETKSKKSINPYLPSKLSDYVGSGNKIWAICEEGSILYNTILDYKSELSDVEGVKAIFEKQLKI